MNKNYIREILKKLWEDDYSDDCDGHHQCQQDFDTIMNYIEWLEKDYEYHISDVKLICCMLNKAGVDHMETSVKEVEECDVLYTLTRYDGGRIEINKMEPDNDGSMLRRYGE